MPVAIAGTYLDRSLNDLQRACEITLEAEHAKLAPDNTLINLLCDAIRLTREMALVERRYQELGFRLLEAKIALERYRRESAAP